MLAQLEFQKNSIQVILYAYNQSSIALANKFKFHQQLKHFHIRFQWIYEDISTKQHNFVYLGKAKISANNFTQYLLSPGFLKFRQMISVVTSL